MHNSFSHFSAGEMGLPAVLCYPAEFQAFPEMWVEQDSESLSCVKASVSHTVDTGSTCPGRSTPFG